MTKQYLLKKDKVDTRDYLLKSVLPTLSATPLPESVDLRSKMSPIVDQGQLGSCSSNASVSGLREYLLISDGLPLTRLSRLYHYYKEREIEGMVNVDSGAFLRDAMGVLNQFGCCPDPDFPYDITKFTNPPTMQAEMDATTFKVDEYHRVMSFLELQQALAIGKPVVIGILVYDSFESYDVSLSGYVSTVDEMKENFLGGHALLATGFKTVDGITYVIVRNSWGSAWGDKGYCYIPQSYWDNGLVTDMWTASAKPAYESIDFSQATDILSQKKIFLSPAFWINLYNKYKDLPDSDFRYVGLALRRFAAYASYSNTNLIDQSAYLNITFKQALDILASKNIISSPDFWINLCTKYDSDSTSDFKYVSLAFKKMASYIQGL